MPQAIHIDESNPAPRIQSGSEWERDADGRIAEYGVVRLPDCVIFDVCATQAEAEQRITDHYAWKVERQEEAERNRIELNGDTLPPTNAPHIAWTKGTKLQPAIKDMEWEMRYRTVTNWEPLTGNGMLG